MSISSRHTHDEQTTPALRTLSGFVCPKCRRRFTDAEAAAAAAYCPDDKTALVTSLVWAEQQSDTMVGKNLDGRFTLLAKLGAGSMGAVYRARQHAMGRDVAVKILRSEKAFDEAAKARFLREARANSVLVSPHTVTVFDFGQSATGELFLAMELLEGESLGQRIARMKRLPWAMAVDTARQALRSLAEAHAKGIVHRDLKPDNLFYARVIHGGQPEEIVKVVDFGIAKMLGEGMGPINAVETQAGTVFGTPRYMSPEQAQAKPLDGRSDLYSLGVLLYHMLAGRPPFTDDDAIIVMARHIKTAPKPIGEVCPEAGVPPEIERVVMRTLAKNAKDRPSDAEAMSNELGRAMDASAGVTTSGVRVSVPTSASHPISRPIPAAASIPPPAPASLSSLGDDDDALTRVRPDGAALAAPAAPASAGLSGRVPSWVWLAGGALALALVVATAVVVARGRSSRSGNGPDPFAAGAQAGAGAAGPNGAASPTDNGTQTTSGAATSMSHEEPPVVDVTALPRATGSTSPSRPARAHSSSHGSSPAPTTSRGRYGILE